MTPSVLRNVLMSLLKSNKFNYRKNCFKLSKGPKIVKTANLLQYNQIHKLCKFSHF